MENKEFKPVTLVVGIVYEGEALSFKMREVNDELFYLKEGGFSMGHAMEKLSKECIKEAFDKAPKKDA